MASHLQKGSAEDCFNHYRKVITSIPVIPNDRADRQLPTLEAISKLKPDFVYGTAYAFRAETGIADPEAFEQIGACIYASKGTYTIGSTLGDVYEDLLNIGRIFDAEQRALEIINTMQQITLDIECSFREFENPKRVFVYDQINREKLLPQACLWNPCSLDLQEERIYLVISQATLL